MAPKNLARARVALFDVPRVVLLPVRVEPSQKPISCRQSKSHFTWMGGAVAWVDAESGRNPIECELLASLPDLLRPSARIT
jgi:hypothetical protein